MRKVPRAINRIKPIVNGIMGSEEKGASCYEPNKEPRVRRGMKGNVIAIVHSVINSVIIFVLFGCNAILFFPHTVSS
jgi:hypothetical protein